MPSAAFVKPPMNRYPLWKYIAHRRRAGGRLRLHAAEFLSAKSPAVQVSPMQGQRQDRRLDSADAWRSALKAANIAYRRRHARSHRRQGALRRHRHPAEGQGHAAGAEARADRPHYIVALEPAVELAAVAGQHRRAADVPRPRLARRRAFPAAGRHEGRARQARSTATRPTSASLLRDKKVALRRHQPRRPDASSVSSATPTSARKGERRRSTTPFPIWLLQDAGRRQRVRLVATLKPEAQKRIQEGAVKQNITILRNRVNELGVAEPMIQQQGADRVVVQLPGVQDTARAKDILGRTATLEIRMVDEEPSALAAGASRPGAVRHRAVHRARRQRRCWSRSRWC